jgi:hypothetical protein
MDQNPFNSHGTHDTDNHDSHNSSPTAATKKGSQFGTDHDIDPVIAKLAAKKVAVKTELNR